MKIKSAGNKALRNGLFALFVLGILLGPIRLSWAADLPSAVANARRNFHEQVFEIVQEKLSHPTCALIGQPVKEEIVSRLDRLFKLQVVGLFQTKSTQGGIDFATQVIQTFTYEAGYILQDQLIYQSPSSTCDTRQAEAMLKQGFAISIFGLLLSSNPSAEAIDHAFNTFREFIQNEVEGPQGSLSCLKDISILQSYSDPTERLERLRRIENDLAAKVYLVVPQLYVRNLGIDTSAESLMADMEILIAAPLHSLLHPRSSCEDELINHVNEINAAVEGAFTQNIFALLLNLPSSGPKIAPKAAPLLSE